ECPSTQCYIHRRAPLDWQRENTQQRYYQAVVGSVTPEQRSRDLTPITVPRRDRNGRNIKPSCDTVIGPTKRHHLNAWDGWRLAALVTVPHGL
ncbi:hypothetical protein BaRGS_00014265, partial [Batillaria attramentaria]